MRKILPAIVLGAVIIALASCGDKYTICQSAVNVTLNASFYNSATGMPVTPGALSLSNLNGTVIYSNVPDRNAVALSLNPATDTAKYHISFAPSLPADTLTFVYTTQLQNISVDCGTINIHTIVSATATHHTIDSLVLVNPLVNPYLAQNVKLYY